MRLSDKSSSPKKWVSIKTKTILYTSLFAAMLLIVVWIFQVVLLNFFYEKAVHNEIIRTADTVEENISSPDLGYMVDALSDRTATDIKVIFMDGYNWSYSLQSLSYGSILNNDSIVKYYIFQAELSDGEYSARSKESIKSHDDDKFPDMPPKDMTGGKKDDEPLFEAESLVHCSAVTTADGTNAYIIVNAKLSPIDATVETIQSQLIVMCIVFIIIASFMGAFIAKRLSTPIIRINESAKKLAEGDYSTDFKGDGFKETAELSDTLNYAADELSKVDTLRRELIANVSHDLRTPLTMIRGYGEVIRDIPGENTPENVQVIIDEADHLRRLVNDILSLSKLESGMDRANLADGDITKLILDIVARYSKMKAADGYDIIFEYSEHITLKFDDLKISQVVYNLVNNAINYAGEDKRVTIKQIRTDSGVKIEVIDTGCGISEENIKHVWQRYYKENKAHKRAEVGTGLGLSIVKGVIDLHGGTCGVISREGNGSTFWFELKF